MSSIETAFSAFISKMAVRVINHFTEMEVPVLTIHDSYIVPFNYRSELHSVMKGAIAAELDGFKINIDEYGIGISKSEEVKSLFYRRQLRVDTAVLRINS